MTQFLKKLGYHVVPSVLGISILCFLLLELLPGDAAEVIAGQSGGATAEGMAEMRARMGLDDALLTRLMTFLGNVLQLDLGYSVRFNMPVSELILQRLPFTLALMGASLGTAIVLGMIAGWIMALFRNTALDRVLQVLVLVLYSTPGFWLGLMAIVLFSVKLGWLPAGGAQTLGADVEGLAMIADRAKYLVLPTLSLAAFYMAIYAPLMRATMIEVQDQEFVRTARAKGLEPLLIQLKHIFPNALIPITTVAGLHVGNVIGGAVVIETVFNLPGTGRLAMDALAGRDFNVLLGVLLMSSLLVIVVNLAIDLLQMWLDPRIDRR